MQTKIHKNTFRGCARLSSLTLPSSVVSVDDCAFYGCTSLKQVNLGEQVKFVGTSAFCGDSQLTAVDRFADTNSSHTFDAVCNYAFAGTGLTSLNLSLRSSYIDTFWGDGCFQDCKGLKEVHFLSANYMSRSMFKGCEALKSVDYKMPFMAYTYPGIFDGCASLTSIKPPAELLFIPEGEFRGCSKLKQLQFMASSKPAVDEVQRCAFEGSGITSLTLPASIDSLAELDPECFKGMDSLYSVTFEGLTLDQIAPVQSEYQVPAIPDFNVYTNVPYFLTEEACGLFKSYSAYTGSNLDVDTDDDVYVQSEEYYNSCAKGCQENYDTLTSIVAAANAKNIPVVLGIGVSHQDAAGGLSYTYLTPQDILDTAAYSLEFYNGGVWTNSGDELGMVKPSFKLSAEYGSKKFNCDYVYDENLVNGYIQGSFDPNWKDQLIANGASTKYINTITEYAGKGASKSQFSAVFVFYTLGLGDYKVGKYTDDEKIAKDVKGFISKLKSTTGSRLADVASKVGKEMRNSGLRAISKLFFGQDPQSSGLHKTLKDYDKYGIVCAKLGSTVKTKTAVQLPSDVKYVDYAMEKAQAEIDAINDYVSGHNLESPYQPVESNANDILAQECVYDVITDQLRQFSGQSGYKATTLNADGLGPDGKRLEEHVFLSKYGYDDAIISSGFFGACHDVDVYTKDSPSMSMEFKYSEKAYKPPVRKDYAPNRTQTSNFQVGKWYYNASDVYREARSKGLPCLFIYSLWGCGPCGLYQKNLWNTDAFQNWFAKQKFLLCGLECEQQPMYDQHLNFLANNLAQSAKNYAKLDQDETVASKPANALGDKFYRIASGNGTVTSVIGTPVLIFMDKDGNCWDYSYHNISMFFRRFGVSGVLQRLKSLCLYHFDGNTLNKPNGYVVDAGKAFSAADYAVSEDNPWQVGRNVLNMSLDIENPPYQGVKTPAQMESRLLKSLTDEGINWGGLYMAGCVLDEIDWISYTFPAGVSQYTTAQQLNTQFQKWYLMIDGQYYFMHFDPDDKQNVDNPCGAGKIDVYKVYLQKTTYSG